MSQRYKHAGDAPAALKRAAQLADEIGLLSHSSSLLGWDQETYMPEAALDERAQQQALLARLMHERLAGDEMARCLDELGASPARPFGTQQLSWADQRLLRSLGRSHRRAACLNADFVSQLSVAASLGQANWIKARHANDFAHFAPYLSKLIELKRQEASLVGGGAEAYDALLDEYEPGMGAAEIATVFSKMREQLVPLVAAIGQKSSSPAYAFDALAGKNFLQAGQEQLGRAILAAMHYPTDSGRLDVSAHPFTTTVGRKDVRITTRYDQKNFFAGISSIVHEAGHALYELGVHPDLHLMLSNGCSLGIHESQSRLWENMVGRSRAFWGHFLPQLQNFLPETAGLSLQEIYQAANRVKASFIRVDADEVTYSLHVMLRFELELGIMRGELEVKDLSEAWREKSRQLLGIVPPTDSQGVLQDIHWSMGSIGYFPTYALGNLYAAMFYQQASYDIPDLEAQVGQGQFLPLKNWLCSKIHQPGAAVLPSELVQEVCGVRLDHQPFMNYLNRKYTQLYDL